MIQPHLRDLITAAIPGQFATQRALAAAAGVSQQSVSTIMLGTRTELQTHVVAKLAKALGLSPTALGRLLYEAIDGKEPVN